MLPSNQDVVLLFIFFYSFKLISTAWTSENFLIFSGVWNGLNNLFWLSCLYFLHFNRSWFKSPPDVMLSEHIAPPLALHWNGTAEFRLGIPTGFPGKSEPVWACPIMPTCMNNPQCPVTPGASLSSHQTEIHGSFFLPTRDSAETL